MGGRRRVDAEHGATYVDAVTVRGLLDELQAARAFDPEQIEAASKELYLRLARGSHPWWEGLSANDREAFRAMVRKAPSWLRADLAKPRDAG